MKTSIIIIAVLGAVLALQACDPDAFDTEMSNRLTVTLPYGVVMHETGRNRLVYIKAGVDHVTLSDLYQVDDGEDLVWIRAWSGKGGEGDIFSLSAPEDPKDTERSVDLLRIKVSEGKALRYTVGSRFDTMTVEPQGRYAVLYHSGTGDASSGDLYNPNEIAIVDLDASPGAANPRMGSIDMDGRKVERVSFLNPLEIGGKTRRLAAFMADGAVRLLDLADAGLASVKVELTPSGDVLSVIPVEILARPGDGERDPMVFVRADGQEDVFGISLMADEKDPGDFTASLNLYEGGAAPTDMALVEDGETPLLIVVGKGSDGYAEVRVIQIDTADAFRLGTDDHLTSAVLIDDPDEPRVVLYGDGSLGVHYLKVRSLSEEKGGNLEDQWFSEAMSEEIPLSGERLLLVPGDSRDLVVLDLRSRATTRISAQTSYDWTQTQTQGDRFFLVPPTRDRINSLDLATGHPSTLYLDDEVQSLHLLSGSGVGLVVHPTPTGRLSLFPLDSPERSKTTVIDGLWLRDLLEETEDNP